MYTIAQAQTECRRTHTAFMAHTSTCHRCRVAYPWCVEGQRLERIADVAGNRLDALEGR
jgi:hypothetical protein